MKLVICTKALENEQFIFGAPFSSYLSGDVYDEENKCVYGFKNGELNKQAPVTGWQSMIDLGDGKEAIVHIDEFTFAPYTIQQYYDMLPMLPEILPDELTEADYLNPNELAVKKRIEAIDESLWTLTPQEYVSQVIIGDKYPIIDS